MGANKKLTELMHEITNDGVLDIDTAAVGK